MEKNLETQTSLLEDSPANLGQLLENKKDTLTNKTVTSGTKWLGLLKTYNLNGSLGKMCEALLTCPWASNEVSLTWKASDIEPCHLLFQLVPQMPNTDENDVGLWATPNTMDHLPQRSEEATLRMQNGHRKGRSKPSNLREQVDEETMKMWPTPKATDYFPGMGNYVEENKSGYTVTRKGTGTKFGAKLSDAVDFKEKQEKQMMWPTPRARDYKDGQSVPPSRIKNPELATLGQKVAIMEKQMMWPTPTATPRGAHTGKISGSVSEDGKTSIRANGTKFGATLQTAVAMAELKKREMYPTPTARDYKDSGQNLNIYRNKRQDTQLGVIVKRMSESDFKSEKDQSGGSLNPEWVEWLMGYEIGHTE